MKCPKCDKQIAHLNKTNDVVLSNKALVLKPEGMILVCPKCKADIPFSDGAMEAVKDRVVLFFKRKAL